MILRHQQPAHCQDVVLRKRFICELLSSFTQLMLFTSSLQVSPSTGQSSSQDGVYLNVPY